MLSQACLQELRSSWLPHVTNAALDRVIDLLDKGSPLLIHGSFTRAIPEGRVHWRIDGQALHGLESGFTLPELCALYLSRNLLEAVAGSPFQRDLTTAVARLEKMLAPRWRAFLDRLPSVLAAATHIGWNHPRTEHLAHDAGIVWLSQVVGMNPAFSRVIREWDACGSCDWEVRGELLRILKEHRRERQQPVAAEALVPVEV